MNRLNFKNYIENNDSDEDDMVFFFQKDGEFYGAPEESRVIFARMKNPDKEMNKNWSKDASFIGINLKDKNKQNVFTKADLGKLKIVDRSVAIKKSKQSELKNTQNLDEK